MKRFLAFTFCFLTFASTSLAQTDTFYSKYAVKTNLFQWLVNEPNITFEYRFSKAFGLETTIGTYGNNSSEYIAGPFNLNPIPYKGIVLRVNPKFYLLSSTTYLSPMLLLKNYDMKGIYGTPSYGDYKSEHVKLAGLSGLIGTQFIRKHFLFDLYGGLGIRYKYIESTVLKFYMYGRAMTNPEPKTNYYSEFAPSIHWGIKIGYSFAKDPDPKKYLSNTYFRHTLTTNVFSSFLREQNISYEYRINRFIGLESIIGGYLLKSIEEKHQFDNNLILKNSYSLYLLPKIYLFSPAAFQKNALYISPMLVYRNEDYFGKKDTGYKLNEKKFGPSLLTGFQFYINNLAFNLYFGLGIHNHWITTQLYKVKKAWWLPPTMIFGKFLCTEE